MSASLFAEIKNALRKVSLYYHEERKQCLANARISRGEYLCAKCSGVFGPKDIQVNHKRNEFLGYGAKSTKEMDWNKFIDELYCDLDGLEVVCKPCHRNITNLQRQSRSSSHKDA